ncbi:uncharacterized protein EV420DRAFT_1475234 [Desarmillaria tabescens]|uniref:Zn(2)-C6 fungal-type domain-containing protein n=1 Tax=Armillaria tabescens TaxID=1929756 RepID=A0AA39TND3_ARMTA|nr:uncharacterized protein EV420DRAFT_1475234 [Desarmillaria tabescens]KAK0464967.1 hypothetical protein EV420DRAFT_1475234 [Desarmillaria tabescens]
MLSQHQAPKEEPTFYLSQMEFGSIYDPNALYNQYYSGSCTAEGESAGLSPFEQTQKEDEERFYATFPEARRAAQVQNQWAMTPVHEENASELEVAADDPDQRPSNITAARLQLNYDYSHDLNGEASAPPESLASSPPEGPPQSPDYGSCYSEQARSDCSPTQPRPHQPQTLISSWHSPDDSDPAADLTHISYPLPHSSPQADSEHASLPSIPSRSLPSHSQVIQIPSRKPPRRHTTTDDHTPGLSRGPFYYKIPLRQPRRSPTPPPFSRRPPAQSIARNNGDRKPPLACFFCRGRKIACGAPEPDNPDRTCNQCHRRSLKCEYPKESRRGMRKKKADGTGDTEAADKQRSTPVT